MVSHSEPTSLQEAIIYFADYANCHKAVIDIRWPHGTVHCPTCGSQKVTYLEKARVWKCYAKHPKAKFSLKVGTIFEDSPVPLQKWLPALWMLTNCKNGISSYELSRALNVTQKTAWFMLSRLRLVLQDRYMGGKLNGTVEADEAYIGGAARNMHHDKRSRLKTVRGRSTHGKVVVMGLLERGASKGKSRVKTVIVDGIKRNQLQRHVRDSVAKASHVYTDALRSYTGLGSDYEHKVVDHAEKYVDGVVHTNGLENFWSLLKRGISGTYVSVEPFHLFRYLDEQAYRFNKREGNDKSRFYDALKGIMSRRLTYAALIGPEVQTC